MNDVLVLMEIVTLAIVSALAVYLTVVLVRVRSILVIVEKDLHELSTRALPVLENIEVITQKARAIAENIDDQVESFRTSIDGLREMVDSVTEFERRLQERIEEPILDTVGTIAAVIKGFQAFFARLRA